MTDGERFEVYERCIACCKKIPRRGWLHTCVLCRWHIPIPFTEWFPENRNGFLGFE